MKKALLLILLLAACKEEVAQDVTPVALRPDTIGYYCQMTLAEHPGPKGQAHLDGLPGAPLFFSQVRDLLAYARLPERDNRILALWVSDMGASGATWDQPGTTNWIDATKAVYVIDSHVEGGMGAPELVPFADPAKAAGFAAREGGQVVTFDAIPDAAVIPPEEAAPLTDDPEFDQRLKALDQRQPGKGA